MLNPEKERALFHAVSLWLDYRKRQVEEDGAEYGCYDPFMVSIGEIDCAVEIGLIVREMRGEIEKERGA
jgi:hypothetical protein